MDDNEPSENDEIPPDTDIEKQYKDNEDNSINKNYKISESVKQFSAKKNRSIYKKSYFLNSNLKDNSSSKDIINSKTVETITLNSKKEERKTFELYTQSGDWIISEVH